jgi:hypothetical protein
MVSVVFAGGAGFSGNTITTFDIAPDPNVVSNLTGRGYWSFLAKYGNCIASPSTPGTISGATSLCNVNSVSYSVPLQNGVISYSWTLPAGWTGTSNSNSITVTPSSNGGTLSVTALNSCGSSNPQALNIAFGTVPNVSASATSTSICQGNSVTLSGGGATNYAWSNGVVNGVPFQPTATQIYTVTGTQGACSATATISIAVIPLIVPSVSISANPGNTFCGGTSVTFTATSTNGGAAPVYQWKLNGNNIGTNSSSYTNATLSNSDVVTCGLTSNATCASPTITTSNAITMSVNAVLVPSVSISANPGNTICGGTSVTFTATSTNGGASPVYLWKLNGNNIGTNSSSYTNATLSNSDVVTCVLTSNANCASPTTASSNSISMTVNPLVTPSVSISATQTTICSGNAVTFTATPSNGGNAPAYQWRLNGNNISGATNATYSSNSLANNDVVTCVLTSNANCAASSTANSNDITIMVSGSVTPSVAVSASPDSICPGESVTFTATPTNGGSTPGYQWKRNGGNISGATNATYATSTLLGTDVFSCVLTSSVGCASPTTATSNNKSVFVKSAFAPTVSVTPSVNSACEGESISFSSAVTGEGNNPTYQWKVNGTNVSGATGSAFSSAALVSGDVITLQLTSSDVCAVPATVSSSPAALTINSLLTPSVSISASQTVICSGANVTFTATVVNGGTNPTYQWKLNSNNISGETGSTYTSTSLVDGDVVSCDITSNASCLTAGSATSAGITLTVNTSVVASVTIATASASICIGQPITFTATPVNGGVSPLYQWKKNNIDVSGATSTVYTDASPANNDVYKCEMTSSASCVQQPEIVSNEVTITVNPLPDVSITQSGNTLSVPAADLYQWFDCANNIDVNGANALSYIVAINGNYAVRVSNSFGCADTSVCVNITGVGVAEPEEAGIRIYPNPATDYIEISLRSFSTTTLLSIIDVAGQEVAMYHVNKKYTRINIADLAPGIYTLTMRDDNQSSFARLVKQ